MKLSTNESAVMLESSTKENYNFYNFFFTQSASFMVGWWDNPNSNHPAFEVLDFVNWSIGIILLVFFLLKPSNRSLIKTLLVGLSSTNEGLMVKTMTSQVSNLSSDSKFSIRYKNSIKFGSD